jgi:hypothetical protein
MVGYRLTEYILNKQIKVYAGGRVSAWVCLGAWLGRGVKLGSPACYSLVRHTAQAAERVGDGRIILRRRCCRRGSTTDRPLLHGCTRIVGRSLTHCTHSRGLHVIDGTLRGRPA